MQTADAVRGELELPVCGLVVNQTGEKPRERFTPDA